MRNTLALALAFLAVTAGTAAAQQSWNWHKPLSAGKILVIKNVSGDVTATPASGSEVEVIARKHSDDVDIKVEEDADGVTICAIYEKDATCSSGGSHKHHWGDSEDDLSVDFEVRVPAGVRFSGHTVSGEIEATGLTADVSASSVSGDVTVATTGLVKASSVSGALKLRMGQADWTGTMSFSTVSGDITLELPASLSTDVHFSTVSGEFESDYPVTMHTSDRGRGFRRGNIDGTIGAGGRELKPSSVSGDVELRKAQ